MKKNILLGILLCLLTSCQISSTDVNNDRIAFFDLKVYFQKEIAQKKNVRSFNKKIDLNSNVEEKKVNNLSLEKELAIFSQSDINKSAWFDKYEIDSLLDIKGNLHHVHYSAKEESLRTQSISISYDPQQEQVDTIKIHNLSSSSIADSEQFLTYIPDYGYSILSRQKINSLSEHNLAVDVEFVY